MTVKALPLAFDQFGDHEHSVLIILHGFFASSRNWRSIAKILSENYRVYVPDMRNHGGSPHSNVMDYPAMAADLKLFFDRHKIRRAKLLGHSMGGKAVMWFALNYPEYVEELVVADISPTAYRHSFNATIQALKELPLHSIASRKDAESILAESIKDASYRQFLLQNLQLNEGEFSWRVDLDIFYRTADNIIGFPSTAGIVPYRDKALFVGGADSDYIRPDDVFRLFPKAQITTIPDTGHWLHVQAPERFCDEVNAFLG